MGRSAGSCGQTKASSPGAGRAARWWRLARSNATGMKSGPQGGRHTWGDDLTVRVGERGMSDMVRFCACSAWGKRTALASRESSILPLISHGNAVHPVLTLGNLGGGRDMRSSEGPVVDEVVCVQLWRTRGLLGT